MEILDRDGRLFGRIGVIRLAAILAAALGIGLIAYTSWVYVVRYRELVRPPVYSEVKWFPTEVVKREKAALILYARLPGYLRDAVSIGDVEAGDPAAAFPLRVLGILPAEKKPGWFFVLLGGEIGEANTGVRFTGRKRPLRLGGRLLFSTKDYALSGVIVRILPGGTDADAFSRLTRQIAVDE
ncbi:MAG: hypothetical protein HYY21_02925 [Candidatus Tectomicrobia bacterium]|nr:hypothetical protein [Candidatus Tectomicrobia bacterium]